jgi:dUTP pyrophosphatase
MNAILRPLTENNSSLKVSIQQLTHAQGLPLPSYGTSLSAGMDLLAAIEDELTLQPGERAVVPSGIAIALPIGYEAQIRARSGLSLKHGLTVLNAPGTIDADYRGEIKGIMINHGQEPVIITRGMRFAQLVIASYSTVTWQPVESLDQTERGQQGFGSTGIQPK